MRTIHKWPLTLGVTKIIIPVGANVMTVQAQQESAQLWADVDPDMPDEVRTFEIYGTGEQMPADPGEYVATFQLENSTLVWHVFESTHAEQTKGLT